MLMYFRRALDWLRTTTMALVDDVPGLPPDDNWAAQEQWFREEFSPHQEIDYTSVRAYAERQFDQLWEANARIDQKAEWLFSIAAAGIGGVYVAVSDWGVGLIWFVPALACGFAVLFLALKTRINDKKALTTDVRGILDITHAKYIPDAWIAASLHCAIAWMQRMNRWKGRHLDAAGRWLVLALVTFALPLVLESWSRRTDPRSTTPPSAAQSLRASESALPEQGRLVPTVPLAAGR
jgi:hypothetical protein